MRSKIRRCVLFVLLYGWSCVAYVGTKLPKRLRLALNFWSCLSFPIARITDMYSTFSANCQFLVIFGMTGSEYPKASE